MGVKTWEYREDMEWWMRVVNVTANGTEGWPKRIRIRTCDILLGCRWKM